MKYTSIVYLTKKHVTTSEWQKFIEIVSKYNGLFKTWTLGILFDQNRINYLVNTDCPLPASINGLDSFILKSEVCSIKKSKKSLLPLFIELGCNAIEIKNYLKFKKYEDLKRIEISFKKVNSDTIIHNVSIITQNDKKYHLLFGVPSSILSIDFVSNYDLTYQKAPKYLDITKGLHLLSSISNNSIFKVDTFPYLQGEYYLDQATINFDRHSMLVGSSGSGKSKFISLLVNNIYKNESFKMNNRIVIIDPHASLENDIGGLGEVIDFSTSESSIDIFSSNTSDFMVSVELLIDVFRQLIPNGYNSKLERVLRHSIYLLLFKNSFNFKNFRKLLLDSEYRNNMILSNKEDLPYSIIEFFLSEFNEIKVKSYNEAISPIIALFDEIEMIPVFNKTLNGTLKEKIDNNFLTIFSLDRTKFGDRVTKTISSIIMENLLTLVQNHAFNEHIIFIVDEVAIIENPILNRFLSESRKYNLSVILSGQYFGGISESLRKCIFANVINYYIFRLSKDDANILVDNIDFSVPLDNIKDTKIKILTGLQDRECIIRISSNGRLVPAMKAKTLDFISIPRIKKETKVENAISHTNTKKSFKISNVSLNSILNTISTKREDVLYE